MPTSYTPLLGLALPATGELAGTWGITVNDSITELVEDSIAATATASVTSGNWTLSTTGSGAVNEARCAVLIPTGTPGVTRNIVAPSQSKAYIVINQSDAAVVLKGALTTGTTIAASTKALCAWDGADFVTVATADIANLSGTLPVSKGGTGNTTIAARSIFLANALDTLTTLTPGAGQSIRINAGNTAWEVYTPSSASGDVTAAGNNAFTGANTFYNATGQTIGTATSTQDGLILAGRAGGSSSYRVTVQPGALTASRTATLPDGGANYTLGYLNIPAIADKTSSYQLATADVGKVVGIGTGGSITIPDATFAAGDAVLLFNNTTGSVTITCSITTAYIAGTDTDKATMTLATRGVASILFVSSTVCVVSGNVT